MKWTGGVRHRATGTIMLTLVLACDDPVQAPQQDRTAPDLPARVQEDRPDEIPFVRISQRVRSFAGYYHDSRGDFVALVADDGDRAAVRREMERELSATRVRGPGRSQPAQITFRRADFTFRQLSHWRDLVSNGALTRHPLLIYIDMDEARNRVTLGVLPDQKGTELAELRALLEALGIPRAALHFETTGPIRLSLGTSVLERRWGRRTSSGMELDSFSTLRDNASPFMGGLIIVPPGCTATLAVDFNGSRHLATNSHCTTAMYELDGRVFFQADGRSRLGRETQDPPFSLFFHIPSRYSDGALALIDAGAPTRRGAIARPAARNGGNWGGGFGTITIDAARPFFNVTAVEQGQVMWAEVQKVGQTTGWTYGGIIATCSDDRGTDGYWRRCSTHATYFARGGDSGSPVFRWFGDDAVTLMGLHWGSSDEGGFSSYSGYQSFARELGGNLVAIAESGAPPAPSDFRQVNAYTPGTHPRFAWSAIPGADQYHVYRCIMPYCTWQRIWTTGFLEFEDQFTTQTQSTPYDPCNDNWVSYYITAANGSTESAPSNSLGVCVQGPPW